MRSTLLRSIVPTRVFAAKADAPMVRTLSGTVNDVAVLEYGNAISFVMFLS